MRAVVQRVTHAILSVIEANTEREHTRIGQGVVVLLGIHADDTETQANWTADKLLNLRVFNDAEDKMNLALADLPADSNPGLLLIPNFTVAGTAQKGRRPDFTTAMKPPRAEDLFNHTLARIKANAADHLTITAGIFGAHMHTNLTNDGPVTLVIEARN